MVESLGGLALALVLVVFMLLKREDLRNRLIRLVGHGRLTVTTKAVDDAGQRISRFLLMQLIINAGFGLVLAVGLFLIGVPHAFLWGFLAAVLRYVPYLGDLDHVGPAAHAEPGHVPGLGAAAPGPWVDRGPRTGHHNVMEPWLFGHSMGVSEVALLVAAAFWAFLWGPVGLVLSSPLTVCLVVLGKYVPQLEFLDVLLGDEPALDPDVSYYQRLLARDQDEAAQLVLAQAKTSAARTGLRRAAGAGPELRQTGPRAGRPDGSRRAVRPAGDAGDRGRPGRAPGGRGREGGRGGGGGDRGPDAPQSPGPGLSGPATRRTRLALEMLRQLLDPARWEVEVLSLEMLSAELVALAGEKEPAVVCIGALPPGGLAHTRYLCKRLRARLPEAQNRGGALGTQGQRGTESGTAAGGGRRSGRDDAAGDAHPSARLAAGACSGRGKDEHGTRPRRGGWSRCDGSHCLFCPVHWFVDILRHGNCKVAGRFSLTSSLSTLVASF